MNGFIGHNLKLARISLRLSVSDLAKKIGVSRQEIYNYESGKRAPNFLHLRKLSNILDKPNLYFFKKLDNSFTKDRPFIFYCNSK